MALIDDLKAFWELDEASGSRADSHSVGPYNLTDNNTVTSGAGIGGTGTAAEFEESTNEWLSRASTADLQGGDTDFTVMAWFRPEENLTSIAEAVVGKVDTGSLANFEYVLEISVSPRLNFRVGDGSTTLAVDCTNGGTISTATWYLGFGWHDSVNNVIGVALFGGSSSTANTSAWTTGVASSSEDFRIGRIASQYSYFDGRIQRAGFWRRVLTSQERTDLYNSGAGLSYAAMSGGSTVSWLPVTHVATGPTAFYVAAGMTPPDKV
jgi:hypothetical protein